MTIAFANGGPHFAHRPRISRTHAVARRNLPRVLRCSRCCRNFLLQSFVLLRQISHLRLRRSACLLLEPPLSPHILLDFIVLLGVSLADILFERSTSTLDCFQLRRQTRDFVFLLREKAKAI